MSDADEKTNLSEERLYWACRRGMLELDLILNQYLKEAYPHLSDNDKKLFVQLLSTEDAELFTWVLGSSPPQDENMLKIVKLIREHVVKTR